MNVEKVESLLERSRPAPTPPDLRRRILEAVDRKAPPFPVSPCKPRWMEVMTVAASIFMLIATLSWLFRTAPPAPVPASQDGEQPFENRRLTDALPAEPLSEFTWSPDGKHWACVMPSGKTPSATFAVVVDGKREKEYSEVGAPKFGSAGHYAYRAIVPSGSMLVVDGVARNDFQNYESFAWSPDGKKLAVIGSRDGASFVVEDGRRSGPYGDVRELLWSPDGSILAYGARIDQDWFCVVNGKKGEPFDMVMNLTFAPDGKTLAYTAVEGGALIVVGTAKGADYRKVGPPVFSGDGSTVGYLAYGQNSGYLVVGRRGGEETRTEGFEEIGMPVASRDGSVWACRAKVKGEPKELVLIVKRQGRRIVTTGQQPPREIDTFSEEAGPYADSVSDPVLNADGSLVAYAAGNGSRKYLFVGTQRTVKFSTIDSLSFGPDGKTVAFRAGQYGKQLVVVGEARSDEFDEVISGPVWSKDGRKVAFTARNGAELWSRVLEVK